MHCYPPTPPWPWYLELHDSCQNSWFSLKNFSQNIPLLAYKSQVFLQVPKNKRNQTIKLFLLRALLFGYIVSFVVRNLCLSTYRKNHCLWVTKYIQIVASSHLKMDYFFVTYWIPGRGLKWPLCLTQVQNPLSKYSPPWTSQMSLCKCLI